MLQLAAVVSPDGQHRSTKGIEQTHRAEQTGADGSAPVGFGQVFSRKKLEAALPELAYQS